jgi:hypothetical protein
MKRIFLSILSIIMVLSMVTLSGNALAGNSGATFKVGKCQAQVFDNLGEKAGSDSAATQRIAVIDNVTVSLAEKNATLSMTLGDDIQAALSFIGMLYPFQGGYYDDKCIVGEFNAANEFNIAFFKIDRLYQDKNSALYGHTVISISLENIKTGRIYEIQGEIDSTVFWALHAFAIAQYNKTDHTAENAKEDEVAKIMRLMQPNKNYRNTNNLAVASTHANGDVSVLSTNVFDSTTGSSSTGASATATTLQNFFTNMNDGSENLTSNSTMRTILTQTGWKMYKNTTATNKYFYVMYGVVNSSYERLVQISLCSIMNTRNSSTKKITGQIAVQGSLLLSYNTSTKVASVIYFETGVRMTNATVADVLTGTGTAFFTEATKTYSLESGNTKNVLIALIGEIPGGAAVWALLEQITDDSDTVSLGDRDFQEFWYEGDVIGAVSNGTNSGELWGSGCNLGVIGTYADTYSSHRIDFRFTGNSSI